jgi:hypothetical protein
MGKGDASASPLPFCFATHGMSGVAITLSIDHGNKREESGTPGRGARQIANHSITE